FSLWSESGTVFLGDSSVGPIFVFDAKTGKQAKIEYPQGETYVYGGSDGRRIGFYHWPKPNDLYPVPPHPDGANLRRTPISECFPNKAYFQPFVNGGVLPCKAKTSVKEHVDSALKISYDDGRILWKTDALKRKGDFITDPKRPDLISLRKGKDG